MQKNTVYRVINFVVLPVSAFIAIQVVMSLIVAFTNPALLLIEFVLACVPIYAFTANYFYNKSVRKGEKCKPSLKEWIKANAIVSIVFSAFMLLACIGMLMALNDPKMTAEILDQLAANATSQITAEDLKKLMKAYCYFFIPFSILLTVHIILTFGILKRYRHMFGYSTNDPQ